VPELVIWFEVVSRDLNFPSEPDFVQNSLSIKSKFIVDVNDLLISNPDPWSWRPAFPVPSWR
jgi:hypothetical protein